MKAEQAHLIIQILAGSALVFCSLPSAQAATVSWNTDASGAWNIGSNWSSGTAPASGDDVLINRAPASPLVTHASGTSTIGSLNAVNPFALTGGSLTLARPSAISGGFTFTSPSQPLGATHLIVNDTLTISGPFTASGIFTTFGGSGTTILTGNSTIQDGWITAGHRLVNRGNAVFRGSMALESGVNIDNHAGAVLDLQNDWSNGQAGVILVAPAINNAGTLRKSSGTGQSYVSSVNNNGVVQVQNGELLIAGGVSSGQFDVSSGAVLTFREGTLTAGSSVNAANAEVRINTPVLTNSTPTQINGAFTAARLTVYNGGFGTPNVTFSGSAPVIGELAMRQSGYVEFSTSTPVTIPRVDFGSGPAASILAGTATVNVTDSMTGVGWLRGTGITNTSGILDASLTVSDGRVLNNSGRASGTLWIDPGSTVNNLAGGTWTMSGLNGLFAWPGARLNNVGVLLWNAPPPPPNPFGTRFTGSITNSGTIELRAGTVSWHPIDSINVGTIRLSDNTVLDVHDGRLHNQPAGVISAPNADIVVRSFGTLVLDGSTAVRTLTVDHDGTLGGSGLIAGNIVVKPAGTLAPGNSIGVLNVSGNVTFDMSSTYTVEVDAAGNADRLSITGTPGTATINGGRVEVLAGQGRYMPNTRYAVLDSAGGVQGRFERVTSNLAFLTPSLSYDANHMYLDLARNDLGFAGAAATPNQIAVAQALTRAVNSGVGSPAMQTVLNNLTGVSTAQARTAFDTMSGASLRGLSDAARVFMNASTQLVTTRQRRLDGDGSMALRSFGFMPLQLTAAEFFSDALPDYGELRNAQTSASWRTREAPRGLWGRAYGTRNDTRDGATNGFHLSGEGFMIGMDGQLNDRWRMGTAIGTGTQRLDVNNVADSGKSRGVTLALYGQYADGPWTVQGLVAAGRNRNYSERHIIVGGTASVATADYTSNAVTAYGEAAYSVFRGGYVLEPMLALSYTRLRNPSFTEQGAGPLALSVNAETRHSTRTFVGTRLVHRIETRAGTFTVEPRLLWAHEFGDVDTAPISAQLTGAGAASAFNVRGVATGRDSAVFGLGLTSQLSKNLKLSADAGAELKSGQSVYGFFAGLRYAW